MPVLETPTKTPSRQHWETVLLHLQREISPANFYTWFKYTGICSYDENDGSLVVGVPNAFALSWLNNRYRLQITNAALASGLNVKHLDLVVDHKLNDPENNDRIDPVQLVKEQRRTSLTSGEIPSLTRRNPTLNPRYTLENFIVGDNNRLANAGARAVLSSPGTAYNPFFVYGGVGLGKTHLIQATGNTIVRQNRSLHVLYTGAEAMTNDLINAIQTRATQKLKEKYRLVDVLIIDDIQFLSGKTRTQEELFHIFETLHEHNKQIIISADRPPQEIEAIDERLKSRFEMGLIADIGVPDYETRLAILRSKCQERGVILAPEVLEFIAQEITNNVRELEGVLRQTIANWQFSQIEPTVDTVSHQLIKHRRLSTLQKQQRNVSHEDVINFTAEYLDLAPADITSAQRKKEIVTARQICMYVLKHDLNLSYELIGKHFGGKNHTTTMHAVRKISQDLQVDRALVRSVNAIRRNLGLL